jgi:hypothetical protein
MKTDELRLYGILNYRFVLKLNTLFNENIEVVGFEFNKTNFI